MSRKSFGPLSASQCLVESAVDPDNIPHSKIDLQKGVCHPGPDPGSHQTGARMDILKAEATRSLQSFFSHTRRVQLIPSLSPLPLVLSVYTYL
jgi:hypothetical protein